MSDLPDLEISKLPSLDAVNKDTDYLVVSKESTAYASGYGSFKVTPNQLMQAVSTTNLSDLRDVNISSPENEQVLKYDSSTNKWINSEDSGGTEVEANPSETATDTLTSIKIDNDVYSIEGGGSNVIANPTGTATTTLNKLQVEETIYSVEGGGGSADHITLTQAEYDALVQAGTVDPDAFYFISDAVMPAYSHTYSTSEQVVGTWIDGSTLYEKTFNITTPSTGLNSIPHNILNIGDIINIEGTAIRSNGATQPLGFISSANNYGWNVTVYDFSTTAFSLEVGGQLSLSKVIVTVRYTKAST